MVSSLFVGPIIILRITKLHGSRLGWLIFRCSTVAAAVSQPLERDHHADPLLWFVQVEPRNTIKDGYKWQF